MRRDHWFRGSKIWDSHLKDLAWGETWETLIDTGADGDPMRVKTPAGGSMPLQGRSIAVLRRPRP